MTYTDVVFCVLYLVALALFAVALRKLYLRVIDGIEEFNKSVSKPCTEIAKGVREARQCAKVAFPTKQESS